MKKLIVSVFFVMFLAATGCTSNGTAPSGIPGVQQNTPVETLSSRPFKEVQIEAQNFSFSPKTIEVRQGEEIHFQVNNKGGFHSFAIPEYSIDEKTPEGQVTEIRWTADKKGTFEFNCSVGDHASKGMKGTITVL
jgi:plastocyanin